MALKKTTTKEKKVKVEAPVESVEHVVTAEDIENNPNLVENGIVEGDVIEVPKKASGKVSRVIFELKNGGKREFSKEIHGDDFVSTADTFGKTNTAIVLSRLDI